MEVCAAWWPIACNNHLPPPRTPCAPPAMQTPLHPRTPAQAPTSKSRLQGCTAAAGVRQRMECTGWCEVVVDWVGLWLPGLKWHRQHLILTSTREPLRFSPCGHTTHVDVLERRGLEIGVGVPVRCAGHTGVAAQPLEVSCKARQLTGTPSATLRTKYTPAPCDLHT